MTDLSSLAELEKSSLLPSGSGVFERVMSAALVRRRTQALLLIAGIRTLWDPWTCAPEQLPLLAWAWSVDIWAETWSLDRKRAVVAEARAFHLRKTTISGFRMALGYVDAELVRANLPRDGFFAGRSPTPAEHDAWLSGLPEIRIYEFAPRTRPGRKGFVCARSPARAIESVILDQRRAVLIRDGVSTDLVFSGLRRTVDGRLLSEGERLLIPGAAKRVMRAGGFVGSPVASSALAGERVITLSFTRGGDAFLPNAISPGVRPAEVAPRHVAEARPAGLGLFASRPRYHRGVRVNDAATAFYVSIRLADGTSPTLSRMRNVIGKTRLRREAYTAGLLVHAARPPIGSFAVRGRIARRGPESLVAAIENAIAVTQAARDVMFLDLNSTRPMTYGDLARLPDNAHYGLAIRT